MIQLTLIMFVGLIALFIVLSRLHVLSIVASPLTSFSLGSWRLKTDTSLFVYHQGADTAYLLLYVDDIVLTASSTPLLRCTIAALQREFSMKDLGALHHFLGMHVQRSGSGFLLSQRQYMMDIVARASMADCKSCSTPVDTNRKMSADDGPPWLILQIIAVLLVPCST